MMRMQFAAEGHVIRRRRRVLVTGKGLLGTAIDEVVRREEYFNKLYDIVFPATDFDLTNSKKAWLMMEAYKPDIVIHTAAKVGGVKLNSTKPETMFYENMAISSNVIHAACQNKVKKIVGFGSTCAFSEFLNHLDDTVTQYGEPYHSNLAYGYAKRMTEIHLKAAHEEYGIDYAYYVPVTMYGPNDNFNLEKAHVIPSLIHKCYTAKMNNEPLRVWGDGEVYRESIFSQDVAAIVLLTMLDDVGSVVVSSGEEISIKEMVQTIAGAMEFKGDIVWETDKPKGQVRRPLVNVTKMYAILKEYGFKHIEFQEGIWKTVDWFVKNYPNVRL